MAQTPLNREVARISEDGLIEHVQKSEIRRGDVWCAHPESRPWEWSIAMDDAKPLQLGSRGAPEIRVKVAPTIPRRGMPEYNTIVDHRVVEALENIRQTTQIVAAAGELAKSERGVLTRALARLVLLVETGKDPGPTGAAG